MSKGLGKKETANIIEDLNRIHLLFIRLQNSGQVDEFEASELTMLADELREKFFELNDKWSSHDIQRER